MTDFDHPFHDEIAQGERWLASFSTPAPSPAALTRTRRAVRAALAQPRPGASDRPWAVWHGILAAAASLALAVTIGWRSAGYYTATQASVDEHFAFAWIEQTGSEAQAFTDFEEALTTLESWAADEPWNVDGADLFETLNGVLNDGTDSDTIEPGSTRLWPAGALQREEV